ncbi:TspO/MBR family protein [Mycobacterium terramassiliense]|uniref:Tryptophan-rich sensory protein (Mitochondrial benzodiazepine receptor homolog) n=1 Tax=Mycobacterium terramassiliense TaxID=1841859 RepID=A0A2U3N9G2_9MYCO|nr:TspO/MBR family protein [Mycobacterium terramassiliense]SPM28123.1 Tryptophan-rich sensory protein (mitochondrial benzodiazepine receptor homolog) [Mycobacterium terramassiliense]
MRTATFVASAAAVVATATVGGLATRPAGQSVWYRQLRKPAYQPPRSAFPVVWPVLYTDIAAVSAATFDRLRAAGNAPAARSYLGALAVNLLLNASWSWVFFNRHRLAAAVAVNAALTASSADLARRAIAVRGGRAAWLCLYPAWCAFAFVLSTHIWMLNRRARIDVP